MSERQPRGLGNDDEKGLAQVHRWTPGQYADGEHRSLRTALERHEEGETHRLLFLNTWLLRAVTIHVKVYNAVTSAGHEVVEAGNEVVDWIEDIDGSDDVGDVEENFEVVDETIPIEHKELIDERVRELADVFDRGRYDVIGLCEVFDESERSVLRERIDDISTSSDLGNAEQAIGPKGKDLHYSLPIPALGGTMVKLEGDKAIKSSGLHTLALDGTEIDEAETREFSEKGYFLRHATVYSRKGVMHAAVDLAPDDEEERVIDYFTTHTTAADNLGVSEFLQERGEAIAMALNSAGFDAGSPDRSTSYYQRRQVDDICEFVAEKRHEHPERVTIVGGDFNIDANGDDYEYLREQMADVGMADLWAIRGGEYGGTYDANDVCAHDRSGDGPYLCDDYDPDSSDESRIDYMFVERPTDEHAYNLDVSRLRRRPFWRGGSADETTDYMSDHLGLEMDVVVSPN